MAKLPDLVRTISETTGESEASIKVLARALREGGLIATFGRGKHGAEMSSKDAASLMLGLTTIGDLTKAAEAVRVLGETRAVAAAASDREWRQLSREEFHSSFPSVARDTLADTLGAIFDGWDRPSIRDDAPLISQSPFLDDALDRPMTDVPPSWFYEHEDWELLEKGGEANAAAVATTDKAPSSTIRKTGLGVTSEGHKWVADLQIGFVNGANLAIRFRSNHSEADEGQNRTRRVRTSVILEDQCFADTAACLFNRTKVSVANAKAEA